MMRALRRLARLRKSNGAAPSRIGAVFAGQEGAGLIEVALVLPIFCLLLFGIFALSMALVSYLSATYWLREATRYAGMHSLTSINPASTAYLSNLVTSNLFLPSGSSPAVTVNYYTFIGPSTGNYVGDVISLTVSWTQTINVPLYSSTLSMQTATYRMITQ